MGVETVLLDFLEGVKLEDGKVLVLFEVAGDQNAVVAET